MYYYIRSLFTGWHEVSEERYQRFIWHIVTNSSTSYEDKAAAIERRTIKSTTPLTPAELGTLEAMG